jgi:tripartite-type tricarboxylate transporter receptor subunit TctC
MCRLRLGITTALLVMSLCAPARAAAGPVEEYPSKPIRLIVPFAAGGGNDTIARLVAQKLAERWSHRVIVDNRAGAGGNIAAELSARAAPDGYTLFLLNSANLIAPSLYRHLAYDPVRDFAPVTLMVRSPFLILVPVDSQLRTLADLLVEARAHPGTVTFGSGGNGSATHLSAELLAQQAGLKLLHIPYKGAAPALVDLLAGRVALYWTSVLPAMPYVKSGRARALALTGVRRLKALPDVATAEEAGLSNYEASVTYGIVAPTGTPAGIVHKVQEEIVHVLNQPDMRGLLEAQGLDVVASTSSDYAKDIKAEVAKWEQIVRVSGAKVD